MSDRQIRSAVKGGATCLRDLTRELGLGTCCGKCLPEAKAALSQSLDACSSARTGFFTSTTATEFAV